MATIFKKIIDKEIPAHIIYEDETVLAFLDISPATKGHTLIIPKTETANFLTADDQTICDVMLAAHKLAPILMKALKANGMNILSNANEIAGQTVMHFHVHLIPRYDENDGFNPVFKLKDETDLKTVLDQIKTTSVN